MKRWECAIHSLLGAGVVSRQVERTVVITCMCDRMSQHEMWEDKPCRFGRHFHIHHSPCGCHECGCLGFFTDTKLICARYVLDYSSRTSVSSEGHIRHACKERRFRMQLHYMPKTSPEINPPRLVAAQSRVAQHHVDRAHERRGSFLVVKGLQVCESAAREQRDEQARAASATTT